MHFPVQSEDPVTKTKNHWAFFLYIQVYFGIDIRNFVYSLKFFFGGKKKKKGVIKLDVRGICGGYNEKWEESSWESLFSRLYKQILLVKSAFKLSEIP